MHVLFATPEVAPFSGNSSIAEVAGYLPPALHQMGVNLSVITPFYKNISPERFALARRIRKISVPIGGEAVKVGLLEGRFKDCDVPIYFVDHPESFNREGLYGDNHEPFPDNYRRFYLFARSVLCLIQEIGMDVDILHTHDWPMGFLHLLLQSQRPPELSKLKTVFTVHHAAQAGLFPASILESLQLGYELYNPEGIEFYGQVSLLKAGLLYSDKLTTLSPSAARELQTTEFGHGLEGLISRLQSKLSGIVSGIDLSTWNPKSDYRIAAPFHADNVSGKEKCKRALQSEYKFTANLRTPLYLIVLPAIDRQGLELLWQTLPRLSEQKIQVLLLGKLSVGDEQKLQTFINNHPQTLVHDSSASADKYHRALAGADALLYPSAYEPGGTLHLKAMRYGVVPLARAVGGLADTIVNYDLPSGTGTGVCFGDFNVEAFWTAIKHLQNIYQDRDAWCKIQQNIMQQNYGWEHVASKYKELYLQLLPKDV